MLHLAEFGTRLQYALAGRKSWVERPHREISWISFSSQLRSALRGVEKGKKNNPTMQGLGLLIAKTWLSDPQTRSWLWELHAQMVLSWSN